MPLDGKRGFKDERGKEEGGEWKMGWKAEALSIARRKPSRTTRIEEIAISGSAMN